MKKVCPEKILSLFESLNTSSINYRLLRNIDNELPNNYYANKDIDVIVHPDSIGELRRFARDQKWRRLVHPFDIYASNTKFLYAMDPFHFYIKDEIKIDVCFQLACRSTNQGEWMPLDQEINRSVWESSYYCNENNWYMLGCEDEIIHLLTRCIFDKKTVTDGYKKRIFALFEASDHNLVLKKMAVVFFKFTESLYNSVLSGQIDSIHSDYIQFKAY